jgi:hypothetical protein
MTKYGRLTSDDHLPTRNVPPLCVRKVFLNSECDWQPSGLGIAKLLLNEKAVHPAPD